MKELNLLLKKAIRSKKNKNQLLFGMIGLSIAILLLMASLQIQINYRKLLTGQANKDSIANFLVINKKLNDQNLSSSTLSEKELSDLRKQPFVQKMGILKPSRFKASIESGSSRFPFYTDVSFETVPDEFIDIQLNDWKWDPEKGTVPIIVPNLFLDLYNFQFSVSQNLPQLTQEVVKMLIFKLNIQNESSLLPLKGRVVGFSDRISSLLVPESFMNWAEQQLGSKATSPASRVIVQIEDPSNPDLTEYLKQHGLTTDLEKTRFSRYRQIIDIIVKTFVVTGFIMLAFALLVFSLFIKLLITSNQHELNLLFTLGMSRNHLKRFLLNRFKPVIVGMLTVVLSVLSTLQLLTANYVKQFAITLSPFISGYTILTGIVFTYLLMLIYRLFIHSSIKK